MRRSSAKNRTVAFASGFRAAFATSVAFALCATLAFVSRTQADNLDEELIRQAPKVMSYLRDKTYANVGVLPFQVKKGNAAPTFEGGLLSANVATRLENALVLALNPELEPVGITRGAGSVALKELKNPNYGTPAERAKLFDSKYPLAWGTDKVAVDAFLAGTVAISADNRTTTLTIEAFDKQEPANVAKVAEFEVKTDRYILADAGKGFSLSKGKGKFSRGLSDENILLAIDEDVKAIAKAPPTGVAAVAPAPIPAVQASAEFPVELKVFYDGKEVQFFRDPKNPGMQNWTIPDPAEGQKVTFDVRNKTDERLGVVLTVNGVSTLHEATGQPDQVPVWVLEPNKKYTIKGFYHRGSNKYTTIQGVSEQLSEEAQEAFAHFGGASSAGLLHLHVLRKSNASQTGSSIAFSRSMRQISPEFQAAGPPKSPADLQAAIARSSNAKASRGLMVWGTDDKIEKLDEKSFQDAALSDTMIVRYYHPKKTSSAPPAAK